MLTLVTINLADIVAWQNIQSKRNMSLNLTNKMLQKFSLAVEHVLRLFRSAKIGLGILCMYGICIVCMYVY